MKVGNWQGTEAEFFELLETYEGNYAALARVTGVHRSVPARLGKRLRASQGVSGGSTAQSLQNAAMGQYSSSGKRIAVGSDMHFPDHDPLAIEKFLEECQKSDLAIINGDLVDFYGLSRFNPDPRRKETLQDELDMAQEFLASIDCPYVFNKGNHEIRVDKYLRSSATALECLRALKLHTLLGIPEEDMFGNDGVLVDEIRVKHGTIVKNTAGLSGMAEAEKHWRSVVMGHTHRRGKMPVTKDGRIFYGVEAGCLCKLDPEYVTNPNWQQGFVVIEDGDIRLIEL